MFKEIKTKTMNKLKLILLAETLLFCIRTINAQIPINDPGWILQPVGTSGGSEEFNSPSLDFVNKWHNQYPWGDYSGGAEIVYPANLISTGTSLKIKSDTLIPSVYPRYNPRFNTDPSGNVTIAYQGGTLQSRKLGGNDVYKFGYVEIEAKYSTGYWSLWPAFWLWSQECSPIFYDEIDICENGAPDTYDGHNMGTNVHIYSSGSCPDFPITNNGLSITGLPLLSTTWHKYAVEWAPDRIIWYFDDVPVRTLYDPTGVAIPQHAMAVILNFAVDPYWAYLPADFNNTTYFPNYPNHGDHGPTSFPQYFEINYLHYYKLNTDCGTALTICTPATDYSSRAVKQSITTGGSCSPTFNPSTPSSSYSLRATNYILLDVGTTIAPTGTGYIAVETMACPQ